MPFGQVAHLGDALGDLLAQQHAAAARLGALADHDLDRVGAAQIVRVHAVARRQILIDEDLRMAALLLRSCRRRRLCVEVPGQRRAAAERFLGRRRQRAEAHAGDRDRNFQSIGLFAKRAPSTTSVAAFLAVALQRIARHRGAEEQQIVEMRQLALGAAAANVVDAGRRGAPDFATSVASKVADLRGGSAGVDLSLVMRAINRRRRCRHGNGRAVRAEP